MNIKKLIDDFLKTEVDYLFDKLNLLDKRIEDMNGAIVLLAEQISKTQQVQLKTIDLITNLLSQIQLQKENEKALLELIDKLKKTTDSLSEITNSPIIQNKITE